MPIPTTDRANMSIHYNDDANIKLFFTGDEYIGLSERTFEQLKQEGITQPSDLVDFDASTIDQIVSTMRKPPKVWQLKNANKPDDGKELVEQEPFPFPAKAQMRLKVALTLVKYYETCGYRLTTENMKWSVMRNFDEQWKGLEERKDTKPKVPVLSKGMTVVKWLESFGICLSATAGVRLVSLKYCDRENPEAPVAPDLLPGLPHSTAGSIELEMIERASHSHPLFAVDNGMVFAMCEEGLRGSPYATVLTQFRRKRDGRGVLHALRSQFAGQDVWDTILRKAEEFMKTRTWSGTTAVTLLSHLAKHRSAYIDIQQVAEHLPVEVPNERSRVTYVLDSIKCTDAEVLAALAAIRQDATGKRVNFEDTVAFLLPTCPVKRKQHAKGGGKRLVNADVSAITSDLPSARGKTGVELRYHKFAEFQKLSKAQKEELKEWTAKNKKRSAAGGSDNMGKKGAKRVKGMIASAMADHKKAFEALSESQAAIVAAMQASRASAPAGASVGAVQVEQPPAAPAAPAAADSPDKLMELAKIASLNFQRILKKKTDG